MNLYMLSQLVKLMPYKRRQPASEFEMDRKDYEGHYSICQFLRDIYHITDNSEIKMKCRVGMAMTKAMNDRLQYYKHKYEEKLDMPEFEEEGV